MSVGEEVGEEMAEMEERGTGCSAISFTGTDKPLKTVLFTSCNFWSWDSMMSSISFERRGGGGAGNDEKGCVSQSANYVIKL